MIKPLSKSYIETSSSWNYVPVGISRIGCSLKPSFKWISFSCQSSREWEKWKEGVYKKMVGLKAKIKEDNYFFPFLFQCCLNISLYFYLLNFKAHAKTWDNSQTMDYCLCILFFKFVKLKGRDILYIGKNI